MTQPAFDFGDEPFDDPSSVTYTVAELAAAINGQLRRGFPDGVWVCGEIDGLRDSHPHSYFSLVEDGGNGRAVLAVSFFAPAKRNLAPLLQHHRLALENGRKVRIFGELDFYAPSGRLSLKMTGIDPRFTLGELSQARDQVVRRLVAAGLFDANRAVPAPVVPLRVGVVTSVGSAAWHDFHHELEQSGFGFELRVCDTRVQGEQAVASVAGAIGTLGRRHDIDVIAVMRGGGARNELATFDAEPIALAIARCPLPVFTGVGHEIDTTVADEVAHRSLKTPTACAAELVRMVAAYRDDTEQCWAAIESAAARQLGGAATALVGRAHRIALHTAAAVERADDRLTARRERLRLAPGRQLAGARRRVDTVAADIARRVPHVLVARQRELDAAAARLVLLDPANLLRRGWTITRRADGTIVRSVADAPPGTTITTQVADGNLTSRIEAP